MFEDIKKILFSMKLMTFLVFIFFLAVGTATFIENDYGTPAAKALVYNARWFEMIIFLLMINFVGNIWRYNLLRKEKIATLTFHVAFIIIVIGAAVTRYISFEGMMRIREGESNNMMVSDDTFLRIKVDDQQMQYSLDKKVFLNALYNKAFSQDFSFQDREISISYADFIPNAKDTLVKAKDGKNYIELVIAGESGRISEYLQEGETRNINNLLFAFEDPSAQKGSLIITKDSNGGFLVNSPFEIGYMKMADQSTGVIDKDTLQEFGKRRLYTLGGLQFVFKEYHEGVEMQYTSGDKEANMQDGLVLNVEVDDKSQQITLLGGKGFVSNSEQFPLNGLNFDLGYGSIHYPVPFSIKLNDFQLERYPGSSSPASFASEVTLIDPNENLEMSYRIYMNNVLDYKGYRFFQSSYDKDELGTILSVNHDAWGTNITYLGYFLMGLGMILAVFMKGSRFSFLRNSVSKIQTKKAALSLVGLMMMFNAIGQEHNHEHKENDGHTHEKQELVNIDEAHADRFAHLLIQDQGGRLKPVHTFASEVMRKVTRKEKWQGFNASQMLLSMIIQPQYWQKQPMIAVSHPELLKKIGVESEGRYGYAPLLNFFSKDLKYILESDVEEANRKKPAERNKYDKDVIMVDERVNVCYMVYTYEFLRVFPKPNDENNTWLAPNDFSHGASQMDSLMVGRVLPSYFAQIVSSSKNNNWAESDTLLSYIEKYQQKFGADIIPTKTKVDWEVTYNKQHVFNNLFYYYFTVGLIFLIILFVRIFEDNKALQITSKVFFGLLVVGFAFHIYGLALRWYISGHAPWSNAYESMVYIAGATVLAGFLFSKNSQIALAATALLSSLILMVAHLNWLDPEITNLVPVLNSYWLMIHVAIITASYGFVGLGCLLGIINLILICFRSEKNEKVTLTIKELTYINEMTLIVGLFMLSVGTFLGGVWANESWGRYWGWDPKETWAFASMLIYTFVLHLRFIPQFKNAFTFNVWAMWAFSSIIMTYFGVNYYLSGLHSYAKGDPVPIPTWVYYAVASFLVLSIVAFFRHKKEGKITIG